MLVSPTQRADAVDAGVDCAANVIGMQHALEDQRQLGLPPSFFDLYTPTDRK